MKEYETHHLIKGEDLNHHGTLFAARAAAWLVEAAFSAAACECGTAEGIVCRNLHDMEFTRPLEKGKVAVFKSRVVYAGKTSLTVSVEAVDALTGQRAVTGFVTFVTLATLVTLEEGRGRKREHGIVLDEAEDEREAGLRAKALEARGLNS